jgi:DNA-directed RNA polymerase specialized sigma24 family protein
VYDKPFQSPLDIALWAGRACMTQSHSVTLLIQGLRGDRQVSDPAAAAIWQRYSADLLLHAHKRMSARVRQRTGSEDVVQDAFATFCRRFQAGEYSVADRDDLLRLLIGITIKKTLMTVRYHTQDKRNVVRENQMTQSRNRDDAGVPDILDEPVNATAEHAAVFEELYERGLNLLDNDNELRNIAVLLIEGLDCDEIAQRLGVTVRTIERKRVVIRQIWKENGMDDRTDDSE